DCGAEEVRIDTGGNGMDVAGAEVALEHLLVELGDGDNPVDAGAGLLLIAPHLSPLEGPEKAEERMIGGQVMSLVYHGRRVVQEEQRRRRTERAQVQRGLEKVADQEVIVSIRQESSESRHGGARVVIQDSDRIPGERIGEHFEVEGGGVLPRCGAWNWMKIL